jgi:phosphatidate cytidylyltransferase
VNLAVSERLFDYRHAFDSPFVVGVVVALAVLLAGTGLIVQILARVGRLSPKLYDDIWPRYQSWLWLIPLLLAPALLGPAWVIGGVCLLSLLCFREFGRVTGLFREKAITALAVLGTVALAFAALDHWDRLYFATAALTSGLIAIVTIPQDRPKGYVQRTALGVLGFVLCAYCPGYIGLLANDPGYRSVVILLVLAVELNDVFAYCVGKAIGGPKLLPATSPGKTVAGAVGALVLTTALVTGMGHVVFAGTAADRLDALLLLGLGTSVLGQFGDLLLSSVKRDAGVKDTGAAIPGHGGLLDRFDSLLLVPPAAYHFLALYLGPPGAGLPERILTGG